MVICAYILISILHSALCHSFIALYPKGRDSTKQPKLTQERDASIAPPSAEKRFDDIVYVELSQVRVLLACPNEQDGLSGLVTHGQCRPHLSQTDAKPRFGQKQRKSDGKEPRT